jgi:hypothetical protein
MGHILNTSVNGFWASFGDRTFGTAGKRAAQAANQLLKLSLR